MNLFRYWEFNPFFFIFALTNGVLWPRLIDFITRAPVPPSHWGLCWFGGECWDVATEGGGERGGGWCPADDLSEPPLWNIAQVQKHISASWRDSTNLNPLPHPYPPPPYCLRPLCVGARACVCVCVVRRSQCCVHLSLLLLQPSSSPLQPNNNYASSNDL